MGSSLRTKESISQGESEGKSFYEIIEASQPFGWSTFDNACLTAFEKGLITEENALLFCSKRGPVTRGIDNIKKRRGQGVAASGMQMRPNGDSSAGSKVPTIPVTLKFK